MGVTCPSSHDHDLLGIQLAALGLPVARVAVADREQEQPETVEIALAEIGDIPAQAVFDDLAHFVAFGGPILGSPVGEGRQVEAAAANEGIRILHDGIDL